METEQSVDPNIEYKVGEIVRYTRYEDDLINNPNIWKMGEERIRSMPDKYFKIKDVDHERGVVSYGPDTIGIAYITKTNLWEKIMWWLLWKI